MIERDKYSVEDAQNGMVPDSAYDADKKTQEEARERLTKETNIKMDPEKEYSIQNWTPDGDEDYGIYIFEHQGKDFNMYGPFTWVKIVGGEIVGVVE